MEVDPLLEMHRQLAVPWRVQDLTLDEDIEREQGWGKLQGGSSWSE